MAVLQTLMPVAVFVVGLLGWPFARANWTSSSRRVVNRANNRSRRHFCGTVDKMVIKTGFALGNTGEMS